MKLKHLEVVRDWENSSLKKTLGVDERGNPTGTADLTYRDLIVTSVNTEAPQENMGAEAKARAYAICGKLYAKGKDVVLTLDERSFIKDRAGKVLTPLAYGRLVDWLEGDGSPDNGGEE